MKMHNLLSDKDEAWSLFAGAGRCELDVPPFATTSRLPETRETGRNAIICPSASALIVRIGLLSLLVTKNAYAAA
jgi:hypothetical protein